MQIDDDSRKSVSTAEELERIGEATAVFERELEHLILGSFAGGARIEGTWEFTSDVDVIPEWTIDITRHSNGDVDSVTFIDE